MRFSSALFALVVLIPAAASGESFVSAKYGFSANFPMAPSVGEPQASESDASGKAIASTVMIQDVTPGVYTAMVTVETYTKPVSIDASSTLSAMVQGFVAQLDAKMKSNKPGKVEGKPARFFSYDTADHSAAGNGVIVLVPAKKPRIYLVVGNYTTQASDADKAALDTFVKSFQFE
jgi:hypothetical protein